MTYSQAQLEAYLDEDLDAGMMSNIEVALREDTQLLNSLSTILSQRESGVHSVGSVWRRASITCPSRETTPPQVAMFHMSHARNLRGKGGGPGDADNV